MNLITGQTGFIGAALQHKLEATPVQVDDLPRVHADYFIHFGSPASNILFNEDPSCIKTTITDFIKVVEYCKRRRIKLVFPSSSTVYTKQNSYAITKNILEEIAIAYDVPYVAFRIFSAYGPGEGHKKDYGSIAYQWCKQMKQGEAPVIFGDGSQTRDFVYIDDTVDFILQNLDSQGVLDIGTGISTSFLEVFETIKKLLDSDIEPRFIPAPRQYIEKMKCQNPLPKFTSLEKGLSCILDSLL